VEREVKILDELDAFSEGKEITHAVALSYGYEGDWTQQRLWKPLVERYGVAHPLVFADGGVVDAGTVLGVHVVRMRRRMGLFHPKLILAIREGAALLITGSANLTRGGLGGNLELVTAVRFGAGATAPAQVLRSAAAFIEAVAASVPLDRSTRTVLGEILRLARIAADESHPRARGPQPFFLTSLERPLWSQILELHGDDPLERLLIVSPFYEQEREVADPDGSLLADAVSGGVKWAAKAARPRVILHVAEPHPMFLPIHQLREAGAEVELRVQRLSLEPRRLHAKLFALLGRKRTTLVWGSANFTPAALLRTPAGNGNVECVLAVSVPRAELGEDALTAAFDLANLFMRHDGAFPEVMAATERPQPYFDVSELIYDHFQKTLTLHATVFRDAVATVEVVIGERTIFALPASVGALVHEEVTHELEEADGDTGKPRLRDMKATVMARDGRGAELERLDLRLNVRFDHAIELAENLLLGADASSPDALLLPRAGRPEARWAEIQKRIAAWTALRRDGATRRSTHQATLDTFFSRVRKGLDQRERELDACRGNRFILARWGREIRRAVDSAATAEMDPARRVFFVHRVATHVGRVVARVPGWTDDVAAAREVMDIAGLAAALRSVALPVDALPGPAHAAATARDRATLLLETP
jgi:hypothetical protein